jgi:hypothetical protein
MVWFIIISLLISILNVHTLVSIGANLGALRDWDRTLPYVNLIKQSRKWGSVSTPWDGNATFDPITGWPTNDFGVVLSTGAIDMGGTYFLYAKGNADITFVGGTYGYISNKTYNTSTNILTALVNVQDGSTGIILTFQNTTGPGLQDITLLQPTYNLTSMLNLTNLILTHLSRFSIIRFMTWTDTNNNFEVNWNDTTPLNYPQYTPPKRNPWETIPYIANQINKAIDIWINLPHNSSDDYILNVARIMLKELNPANNIYVEYSNEVWNYMFPQAEANLLAANDSVYNHDDPFHLNYDNISNSYTWAFRRTAYQIKHISDLFKIIFGEENVGPWKRVRPILAGEAGNPYVIKTGLDYLNNVYGPPSEYLHGIGIAPYFTLGEYRMWTNLTTEQVFDAFNSSIERLLPEYGWSQQAHLGHHAVYAAWYKLAVHAYEGGPDTVAGCGDCSLEAKINATRDPCMSDLCIRFLNGWSRFGFETFNWYAAGAGPMGKSGSWNLLEDMRQEILIDTTKMFNSTSPVAQLPRPSPKLKAIDQFRQSSIQFKFGIPIPSYDFNATNFMNHRVPYPYPDLRHLVTNSTFYYPLQILQSPIQINVTVYVGGNSSILEGSINNEQFIQVKTPQTFNSTTFQAAPPIQFNIDQTIIPSIVTLRLKNIQNGYSIRSFDVVISTN